LECQQKKNFKGIYYITISDIRGAPAWLKNVFHAFVCGALSSDNRMVCFCSKAFLKYDTSAGLTRN
jgi:hypothetical protein